MEDTPSSLVSDTTITGVEKTCILCDHIHINSAEGGYSEMTPGCDMSIYCGKDHWSVDIYTDYVEDYRRKLLKAQSCLEFTYCGLSKSYQG